MLRMKRAACMVVPVERGRIVAVHNPGRRGWNLPGGNVERGESFKRAAIRECYEETGVLVRECFLLFRGRDGNYAVYTYLAVQWTARTIRGSEEGDAAVVPIGELVHGHFPEYSLGVLAAIASLVD